MVSRTSVYVPKVLMKLLKTCYSDKVRNDDFSVNSLILILNVVHSG